MDCLPDNYKKFDDKCIVRSNLKSKDDVESAASGIPLGCVLSSSQKADVFRLGVVALFEILPIKVAPSVIITDDDLEENLNDAKKQFEEFSKYPKFTEYVKSMIERIELWLLKDIALERTKAFNLTQLSYFIVNNFECYYKQRLLDVVLNRVTKSTKLRYIHDGKDVLPSSIVKRGNLEFSVTSSKNKDVTYIVDMMSFRCSCYVRYNGKHCKHQAAVAKKENIISCVNTLSLDMKMKLYVVACGENLNHELFLPLQGDNVDILTINQPTRYLSNITTECISINEDEASGSEASGSACTLNVNVPTTKELDDLKEHWKTFCNEILIHLDDNPIELYPAISIFLKNREKCANSNNSLILGLHNSFKYHGTTPKHKRLGIKKGKMISVQPTSAARRKSAMGGKKHSSAVFLQKSVSVDLQLNKAVRDKIKENRSKLFPIVSTIVLCGTQDLALRGKETTDGNFQTLIDFRVESGHTVLADHLKNSSGKAKYISHRVQNEIINICGSVIRKEIIEKINNQNTVAFSLIADETADISGWPNDKQCANYLANSVQDYFKVSFFIPYIDSFLYSINNRLSDENNPSFFLFNLHPENLLKLTKEEYLKSMNDICKLYEIENLKEAQTWHYFWKHKENRIVLSMIDLTY
ncbi:unnamed protein product [Psylliodes chrysocephalus]|uniref:SWIM-type domain-containing protein n=1 Tax=Psylliodes chrysocephalus TaxID=3402493 RepID=A0A9P0CR79_9CUCU|nr:unnamed protein product [Psylliodes chrysocephala]